MSEASYIYILSGQRLIKNAKNARALNLSSFWKPEASGQTVLPDRSTLIRQKMVNFVCGQTVLPDRSILIGQKLVENATT